MTVALALALGCSPSPDAAPSRTGSEAVRALIEAEVARGIRATWEKDIDAFMDGVPLDYRIYDESGEVITREQLRANTLRNWAVIPRTLALTILVDSLELSSDSVAVVWSSQRWERLMGRPDRPGEDTVLTTQKHRETWRLTNGRWLNYVIEELGGEIVVNGKPYRPGR
jgi:hypothetical protein